MKTIILGFRQNFNRVFIARMIEWEHAVALFMFGAILSMNPDLFGSPSYAAFMRLWDSPQGWGIVCMAVGALRFAVLAINGAFKRSPHLRAVFAALSAFMWMQISFGFLAAGNYSTALAVYPGFIVWEFIVFVMTVRYAKWVDEGVIHAADHHV